MFPIMRSTFLDARSPDPSQTERLLLRLQQWLLVDCVNIEFVTGSASEVIRPALAAGYDVQKLDWIKLTSPSLQGLFAHLGTDHAKPTVSRAGVVLLGPEFATDLPPTTRFDVSA